MIEPIKVILKNNCKLIAHRGLALINPENTLEAFLYAAKLGYYGMECDIHVTKDNQFVVFHDENLERMTGIKGNIKDYTVAELKKFNIIKGSNIENYRDVKIPLLTEYLEICESYSVVPVIEIKEVRELGNLDSFIRILKDYKLESKAIIISFVLDYLIYLRNKDNKQQLQLLIEDITPAVVDTCLKYNFQIDVYGKHLTKEKIQLCLDNNLEINVWTIDDKAIAELLSENQVKYITTNCLIAK